MKTDSNLLIVDYGFGNLHSVEKALAFLDAKVAIANDPALIARADGVILPGVGAFGDGIKGLDQGGFVNALHEYALTGKPLLGICLGMQFLFSHSEEFGIHKGLDLIPGKVIPLAPRSTDDGFKYRVPQIGWNTILMPASQPKWNGTVLQNIQPADEMYFVHSFRCVPDDQSAMLGYTLYGGNQIAAVVRKGNIYGCQFHPEKSRDAGLRVLQNFLDIVSRYKSRIEG